LVDREHVVETGKEKESHNMQVFYGALYSEHYGPVTTAENASRISVAAAAIYHEFPDRIDLVTDLAESVRLPYSVSEGPGRNCPRCTLLNDDHCVECEACGYADICRDFFRYVSKVDGDTSYVGRDTERCVQNALATVHAAVDYVDRENSDAFALIRPPGHHCGDVADPRGFCHYNNAVYALDALALLGYRKLALVDWDAHRGDGTQFLLRSRTWVTMYDMYERGAYPYGDACPPGNVLEFPMPSGSGDAEAIDIMVHIHQQLTELAPDAVVVSCGFDSHADDPMSTLQLSNLFYSRSVALLASLPCRKLYVMEGGYNPQTVASCVLDMLRVGQAPHQH
jgi:acetoin utilization deacetylase AcuC-like enzyme